MRFVNCTLGIAAAALIACAAPAGAQAPMNDKTILTFDAPVLVPGATLPAGTYVFRQADATSSREVIQVRDEATHKLYTTTFAIPATRLDPRGNIAVTFASTRPGTPPAVKSWFAAGEHVGHHFLYPPDQAREIATTTKTLVLSADSDPADLAAMRLAPLVIYDVSGAKVPYDSRRLDYETSRTPNVRAAADDRAPGSGRVDSSEAEHGDQARATADQRAEQHLDEIVELTTEALAMPGAVSAAGSQLESDSVVLTRSQVEQIRRHASDARQLLEGERASATGRGGSRRH